MGRILLPGDKSYIKITWGYGYERRLGYVAQ